ncbi:proline--tRNA ligase [Pseudonocardia sp. MH-G8]|uniref:proline--tRNA ligase n=1 Tax=Pseudonocardia sp. MH-G8 TaxID=1854588 RepID=UPI000B9FBFA3|nr:proline--tRNA ligase [Pseudonocardia sp. MH-G8]OZM79265.1 proline--tRNA ligase [Pseudonocardia sp. MH-G8]
MAKAVLTPQAENFPAWYQDVVARAELAENGPARGTMVIRPWGYAIWELMQADMDRRIKATGAQNVAFPMLFPMSFLEKEEQHVEGFSPELAVVTHGGGEELAEPLVVRPTSETVINHYFAKWVQSHRDLPLMVNLWNNVVRWELRPRLFLRTTEFLWQEGHTAHATFEDAVEETRRMVGVYRQFMQESLAISVVVGEKSAGERFAGADHTLTCEALMRDGKALQMGTSHNLGHNFARAFDIRYLDADGERRHVATTSWGTSTRMIGGLIMVHGDDHGLRLPPAIAPHQVVVLQLDEDDEVAGAARRIEAELRDAGVRAHVDDRTHTSFGRRSVDWELKGVPVRIELGARELASGRATLVRRDDRSKSAAPLDGAARAAAGLLEEIQQALLAQSRSFREERTHPVTEFDEFARRVGGGGLFLAAWSGTEESERALAARTGATVRCIVDADPPAPTCLITGEPARHTVLIGRAY